jgi:PPOX class probable F420-dependent enzyme
MHIMGQTEAPITKGALADSRTWETGGRATVLDPFIRQRNVLLTTYRRDGTPKGTPVHIAVDGDRAFFRTWDTAWKLKRIRANPNVTIAPSTVRGEPTGPAIHARARVLSGEEAMHAAHALARKYPILHGIVIPLFHRLRRYRTMHIELTPAEPSHRSA